MGRLVLLVLTILLSACAAPDWPRHVSTDEGTPQHVQIALTQAMTRWNALSQGELGYDLFEAGEGDVTVHPYLSADRPDCDTGCGQIDAPGDLGWKLSTEVWVNPDVELPLVAILVHELGHVLGLRDAYLTPGTDDGGVMGASYLAMNFTLGDRYNLRQAARVHETAADYPW